MEGICASLGFTVRDLFNKAREPEPAIVRDVREELAGLRSRLTPCDRERGVTVVVTDKSSLDAAITRALALAVEGEIVQVALKEAKQ